jgi:hypothetical protein
LIAAPNRDTLEGREPNGESRQTQRLKNGCLADMEQIRPETLTPRSDVDFTLPQHRDALLSRGKTDLSVYLMALAAYQRGLDVTFYGSSVAAKHMAWGQPI